MANPSVQMSAMAGYFADNGFFTMTPGQTYTLELVDGVTGEGGDGDYTVVFASNELTVYGTGTDNPAFHIVKRNSTNPVGQPFDLRVHKVAQYLVVNGAVAGERDLRVLGGVDASNLDPGTMSTITNNVTTGTVIVSTLAGDTDVDLTSPTDDQLLVFDATTSKWINSTLPGEAISALPVAVIINPSDLIVIDQAGVTKTVAASLLASLIAPLMPSYVLTAEDGTMLTAETGTTLSTN